MRASSPSGTVDHLFDAAREVRGVEATTLAYLQAEGFEEVLLPMVEREEVFASLGALRFVDRQGELLGLRADFTGPAARVVATRLKGLATVQLCYRGSVFRDGSVVGERRQYQQAGFELYDAGTVESDARAVRLGLGLCDALGLRQVHASLGSAALIEALCPEAPSDVRAALDRRDRAGLPSSLLPLLKLSGGVAVLDQARRSLPKAAREPIDRLVAVIEALGESASRVVVDLAEVRPWAYYSGVVFDLFAAGLPKSVGGGGRYDGLVGRFGADRPAVGASIDVGAVAALQLRASKEEPRPLRFALPKGRLRASTLTRLGALGPTAEALDSRRLLVPGQGKPPGGDPLSFVLVKDPDLAAYVGRGAADVGMVGLDVLLEADHDVLMPVTTSLGACKMCLCGRPGTDVRALAERGSLRVATKYVRIARQALDQRGLPAELIELQGSVELAVLVDMADVIVDLVETGATLAANGLVVLEELMVSTARVIVNRAAWRLRNSEVLGLLAALEDPEPRA